MFTLEYNPKVKKDLKKLSKRELKLLEKIIIIKLSSKPQLYGKNLRGDLKDYRSIRIGNYRIVFRILRKKVYILTIAHRKEVYEKALKRVI